MDSKQTQEVERIGEVTAALSADNEIAKPSADCCLKGTLHSGTVRGKTISVAGIETYIVEPPQGKANGNIVLWFPDVWGFYTNNFRIMDGFADEGYLTLGLDYFEGDPVWKHRKNRNDKSTEPDFDYGAWRAKHVAFSQPATPIWVKTVKEQYGKADTKFACVGYCYGAPYVMDQLADGGICTAGAFAHPAFLKESHFTNLKRPLFLSCAEVDHTFPNEMRNRAVDIMQNEKKRFQLQLFQGVEHGFALRGDPNNAYARYTKEQSLKSIAEWFDLWLSEDGEESSTELTRSP